MNTQKSNKNNNPKNNIKQFGLNITDEKIYGDIHNIVYLTMNKK